MIRTRIAPSPTGFPHIGTIYQALFDYAYARKNQGRFVVRIEDTDKARVVDGAEQAIFEALDWFGLKEDESTRSGGEFGPYRQSDRLHIYKEYAEKLVSEGHAYYCFCSKDRLESIRKEKQAQKLPPMYDKFCRSLLKEEAVEKKNSGTPWVIRLKVPEKTKIVMSDLIRGSIEFDSDMIDDQVLLKSDGFPTYHLAVVVDDHLMKITNVVRGEEWIPSGPKHVLLYQYFNWEMPVFFHTPILRNPDKSKFSKRHGHTSVAWYKEQGFLPEAILNYMSLMGWSHPEGKDIFSLEEFMKLFDLKDVKPVGPIFDLNKLEWMNGQYIMALKEEELSLRISSYYSNSLPKDIIAKTIPLVRERIRKLSDYKPLCEFLFSAPLGYEIDLSTHKDLLLVIRDALSGIAEWSAVNIGQAMLDCAKKNNIKNSLFFMILRVVISGKKISPPLNESMEILGKEESVKRIEKAVSMV